MSAKLADALARRRGQPPGEPSGPSTLETYGRCMRDAKHISETLRNLLASENRHGDLVQTRSAALRLADTLQRLIDAKEQL